MEVQPQHTGRRTQTQWQCRECQPGQPASTTLTVRRRMLHSCHDYTAGKFGLALNGSSAARCPLLAQSRHHAAKFQCPLTGVKRTFLQLVLMSVIDPNRAATAGSRRTGRYENGRAQSTFMFANLTTLAHLSVSAAICFAASAGDPPSTVSPRSAIRALIR